MKTHKRSLQALVATILAIFLVVSPVATAQAVNWYVYFNDPYGVPADVWKTVTTGANYNGARTRTLDDPNLTAWAQIVGLGTASGGGSVTMSFSYQAVTAKCKWNWFWGFGKTLLVCDLRY